MIPAERGDGRDEGIVDLLVPAQSGDRAFEIDGVPEHDRSGDQIEAPGPVALIFKRSIPDLAEAVNDPEKSPKAADRVLANSCVAPNTRLGGKRCDGRGRRPRCRFLCGRALHQLEIITPGLKASDVLQQSTCNDTKKMRTELGIPTMNGGHVVRGQF